MKGYVEPLKEDLWKTFSLLIYKIVLKMAKYRGGWIDRKTRTVERFIEEMLVRASLQLVTIFRWPAAANLLAI